jgi:predicted Fe-S protein YdhL (DUF1289 family)
MGIFNYRAFKSEKNTSSKATGEEEAKRTSGRVKSPCTNKCGLDQNRLCTGCGRTLAEIIAWGEADDAHRERILEELKKRKRYAGKGK